MIRIGDYVVRKSYNRDILFKVTAISEKGIVKLKGVSFRIVADAPMEDIELAGGMRFTNQENNVMQQVEQNVKSILAEQELQSVGGPILKKTGKVLHIDGDAFYLNLCMKYYEVLNVNAVGENVLEAAQPKKVKELIEKHKPDILVLTGHDSLNKNYTNLEDMKEYRNSGNFVNAVIEARTIRPTTDQLVIYAGACQSNFEAILSAGADYASSPNRVLIHALDPPFIVERIAHWPFQEILPIEEAVRYTLTQFNGVGGFEIVGRARKGGPVVSKSGTGKLQEKGRDINIDELTNEQIEHELNKPIFSDELRNYLGNSMPFRWR
ncbi:MAG: sporulation peptidase YabG [Cellulosilyticaceae bacterium]